MEGSKDYKNTVCQRDNWEKEVAIIVFLQYYMPSGQYFAKY